jgi:hypothetical protein
MTMINRNIEFPANSRDDLRDQDPNALHNYNPRASNESRSPNMGDDVIKTLANAYENKRARQVTEWERMFSHSAKRPV